MTTDSPAGPSVAGRFAAAIALTIGFYVLALTIAAALIAGPILGWVLNGTGNIWVTITGLVLGFSILAAIVPRRIKFEAPGLEVTESDQPRLFELVRGEADAAGEPMPDAVYLTLEANAAVTQASRTKRVLIVGIPLLQILSERELRGVLAHEFGHYTGGDTRLGPWIYRTRETIIRTVTQLSDEDGDDSWSQKVVRQPFIWYGRAFLRITAAISRRQEFAADACAVRSVGRAAHVSALERIHAYAPGFDFYWEDEVVPILRSGRRPPVSEGFQRFITHETVEENAGRYLDELRQSETDPYDSHPSLPERIDAVKDMPDGEPDDSPCSIDALHDAAGTERKLLEFLLGDEIAGLPAIAWDEVGADIYGARARQMAEHFPAILAGVTIGSLPDAIEHLGERANTITDPDIEDRYSVAAGVLGDGVLLALERAGWSLAADPAEPICARRGDEELAPHPAIHRMRSGDLTAEAWRERVEELGVAELELGVSTPSRA
jgi:Zn-dependent protease with chaperone function